MISKNISAAAKLYDTIYPTSKNHFYALSPQLQREWIDRYKAVEKLFVKEI